MPAPARSAPAAHSKTDLRSAAVRLADAGYRVVPLIDGVPAQIQGRSPVEAGPEAAEQRFTETISRGANGCGIVIPKGVMVIEISDTSRLVRLNKTHGCLTGGPRAQFGCGREQLWFSVSGLLQVGNGDEVGPGVFVLGAGALAIVPPSIVGGQPCTWNVALHDRNLPPAPDWLIRLARSRRERR